MRAVSRPVATPIWCWRSVSANDCSSKVDDLLSDGDPLGRRDCVGISANGVGYYCHTNRIGVSRGSADVSPRRLDPSADPAEQVDLVGDVDPEHRPARHCAWRPARPGRGAGRIARFRSMPTCGSRAPRSSRRLARARPEPRDGDANVGVRRQRVR